MLPGVGVFLGGEGAGDGGGAALAALLRARGFEVRALWAPGRAAAAAAATALGVPFHTHCVDALLLRRDVALVFVAAAPGLRAQIAVKALGIGKHVVCEPPAGLQQAHALKMLRAGQYYPALISVLGHPLRFLPAAGRVRSGRTRLGRLRRLDARMRCGPLLAPRYGWQCERAAGGGALTLLGSHAIDLATFLTDQRALRVHGVLRTFAETTSTIDGIRRITAPDFCTFQMEMDDGLLVTATLDSTATGPCFDQEFLMCGEFGQFLIKGSDLHGKFRRSSPDDIEEELKREMDDDDESIFLDEDDPACPIGPTSAPRPFLKGLDNMIGALKEAFLPAKERAGWIKEPVESAATFEDGLYVQAVMEAIRKSDVEKKWVDVTLLAEQPDPNPMLSAAVRRTNISLQ